MNNNINKTAKYTLKLSCHHPANIIFIPTLSILVLLVNSFTILESLAENLTLGRFKDRLTFNEKRIKGLFKPLIYDGVNLLKSANI